MKITYILTASIFSLAVFTACSGEESSEQVYENWEEAVQIESEIESVQGPLAENEQQESTLYSEMLSLSEMEEIEPLSEEAVNSAEERRELMEEEKSIVDEAYEQFTDSTGYIEDIEEEAEREAAESVIASMDERYEAYNALHDQYMDSIDNDIELYEMIASEEVEVEELQAQHENVNESYEQISELNAEFNEKTNEFNDAKMDYYNEADLNVQTE